MKNIFNEEAKIEEEAKAKEFWSEEQTMNFLSYNKTSMISLRNSKGLSKYQIGHRFFYDPKEIMTFIEKSKVYKGDRNEMDKYIKSLYNSEVEKEISKKELSHYEKKYILDKSYYMLSKLLEYGLDTFDDYIDVRQKYIILNLLKYDFDFSMMSDVFNLSNKRIKQLFDIGISRLLNSVKYAKNRYDDKINENKEYINKFDLLREENNQLIHAIKDITTKYNKLSYSQRIESSDFVKNSIKNIDTLSIPVRDLDISTRTLNVLKCAKIESVGDILINYKERELMRLRNFGRKSFDEVKDLLEEYGLI